MKSCRTVTFSHAIHGRSVLLNERQCLLTTCSPLTYRQKVVNFPHLARAAVLQFVFMPSVNNGRPMQRQRQSDILADHTATLYDRLLASSCRLSVRLSVSNAVHCGPL